MTIINPKYEYLHDFIERIPSVMDAEGTYIYGGRRNLIKMFTSPDGINLNVKRYHRPHALNIPIYSFGIRKPKGWRAYNYPTLLREQGIETPEEVAYIEKRRCGLLLESYFVSIQCPYKHLMYEMGNATEEECRPVAVALARFAATMHDHHLLHRDFSPGNILWEKIDGEYRFSLVDINRMYFGEVDIKRGCTNFARLWGQKYFFSIIAEEYAKARGFDEKVCKELIFSSRAQFWKHYLSDTTLPYKLEL